MAALDEFVLPWVGPKISETDAKFVSRGFRFNVEDYDGKTKIWAERFDVPATLSGSVRVTSLDDAKQPVEIITAKRAQWDPRRRRWVAFDGFVEKPGILVHPPGEKPHTWKEPIPEEGVVVESRLTPETLRKDMGVTARLSFDTLKNQIRAMRRYPHLPSAVLQVHARFSFPLSPIVLLLLGLPFVMDPQSKSFVKGLIFCFLLSLGFYLTHFACIDMGNRGTIPPVVGAWFPVGAFGAGGLLAFSRMRT
jgi:lipopolysaccharide export system permease protein